MKSRFEASTTLLLEALGYRVLEAESGQDALRLFESQPGEDRSIDGRRGYAGPERPRGRRGAPGPEPGPNSALPERLHRRYGGSPGHFARRSRLSEKALHAQ